MQTFSPQRTEVWLAHGAGFGPWLLIATLEGGLTLHSSSRAEQSGVEGSGHDQVSRPKAVNAGGLRAVPSGRGVGARPTDDVFLVLFAVAFPEVP